MGSGASTPAGVTELDDMNMRGQILKRTSMAQFFCDEFHTTSNASSLIPPIGDIAPSNIKLRRVVKTKTNTHASYHTVNLETFFLKMTYRYINDDISIDNIRNTIMLFPVNNIDNISAIIAAIVSNRTNVVRLYKFMTN